MLTSQQQTIIAAARRGDQSIAVKALAGSGKTTTLGYAAGAIPGTGLATSFSKATVTELGSRMPSSFPARTMHGMGLDSIRSRIPKVKIDSKGDVLYSFISEQVKALDEDWTLISPIKSLVEMALLSGINPGGEKFLLPDTPENWEELSLTYDIDWSPLILDLARKALIHINNLALSEGTISFGQMLTLPLFHSFPVKQHKYLLVDEAQDLSPIQHALLARALRHNGKIICCGDPNQAIYAFAGAMSDSYSRLSAQFSCQEYPLTVSWRCSKAVIRVAQTYVPEIEHAPSAIEGDVIHHAELDIHALPPAVLCRNNAPLAALAMRCIVNGISCEIAGRDIGAGLKTLTKRIASSKSSDSMKSAEFMARVHKWAEREISRKPRAKPKVQDKVEVFAALAAHLPTLGAIRRHIDALFVSDEPGRRAQVHMSTIHAAKGKEWDEVLFLDSFLLPSKYATLPWELLQEHNLGYVAVTRAKQILHYASSENIV